MHLRAISVSPGRDRSDARESRSVQRRGRRRVGALTAALLVVALLAPAAASAHGAVDPVASSYRATVKSAPAGLDPKIVDGDLRLWLQVPGRDSVFVLDYQGARYLRFADGRVWANTNSQMYYFNQTPPVPPPPHLRTDASPHWIQVGSGSSYEWHDGRLQALSVESIRPGASYVGAWRIPLVVNGRRTAVEGTLWHRGAPSIVWFWPIAILLLCVVAGWRLNELRFDLAMGRIIAMLTLFGILLAAIARGFHGRPGLSGVELGEAVVVGGLAVWTALRIKRPQVGALTFFLIAVAAAWEGITLFPTLVNGYVLLAVPPFVGRVAAVTCLGGAIALLPPAVRIFSAETATEAATETGTGADSSELSANAAAPEYEAPRRE